MSKALDRYVDAVVEMRALKQAAKDDGMTEARAQGIRDACYLVNSLAAHLTSREFWRADRLLNAREAATV